jgi:hypothetical protein
MRKFEIAVLIGIGCVAILLCCLLNSNTPEWNVEVLDMPNITRENIITSQGGIEAPVRVDEVDIRVAVFQIKSPKGELISHQILRAWANRGLIQCFLINFEDRDLFFRFSEKRIEIWTPANRFFIVENGKIIFRLLNDDGKLVAETKTEGINIYNIPPKVDEI